MVANTSERVVGWRLARRVASSSLYADLSDPERAECDELVARGNPQDLAASERIPDGVTCRLAVCTYKGDCERTAYCHAAILETDAYRRLLRDDTLPGLRRVAKLIDGGVEPSQLAREIGSLLTRINRTI